VTLLTGPGLYAGEHIFGSRFWDVTWMLTCIHTSQLIGVSRHN